MLIRSWISVSLALCVCMADGLQAEASSKEGSSEKIKLHVLPAAFSAESKKHYGEWISRLESQGYGNAVWLELEDLLFDDPSIELIQSPMLEEEFQNIIRARSAVKEPDSDTALFEVPDRVVTINTNFFARVTEKVSVLRAQKSTEFSVTLYLRYYDISRGRINRAIPAHGSAVDTDPIKAIRLATRVAANALFKRLAESGALHATILNEKTTTP